MMKLGEVGIIVNSVEEAIKFYTEKLPFDVVDLQTNEEGVQSARLRKGKCLLTFRKPHINELAEFSFIKRCMSRCVSVDIELKKDLEPLFDRCQKRGIPIVRNIQSDTAGKSFVIKDPFGVRVTFTQSCSTATQKKDKALKLNFFGMSLPSSQVSSPAAPNTILVNKMADQIKPLGISRRTAKKFSKHWLKSNTKKS